MEWAWFEVINALALWIFVTKPFTWENEPGKTQRFIWQVIRWSMAGCIRVGETADNEKALQKESMVMYHLNRVWMMRQHRMIVVARYKPF